MGPALKPKRNRAVVSDHSRAESGQKPSDPFAKVISAPEDALFSRPRCGGGLEWATRRQTPPPTRTRGAGRAGVMGLPLTRDFRMSTFLARLQQPRTVPLRAWIPDQIGHRIKIVETFETVFGARPKYTAFVSTPICIRRFDTHSRPLLQGCERTTGALGPSPCPLLRHLSPLGEKAMSYEHDDKKA